MMDSILVQIAMQICKNILCMQTRTNWLRETILQNIQCAFDESASTQAWNKGLITDSWSCYSTSVVQTNAAALVIVAFNLFPVLISCLLESGVWTMIEFEIKSCPLFPRSLICLLMCAVIRFMPLHKLWKKFKIWHFTHFELTISLSPWSNSALKYDSLALWDAYRVFSVS